MAKLGILIAVLVAFLALAEASRYTVTTTVEEENQGGQLSQRRMRQIQEQLQQLDHCALHLAQGRGSTPYAMEKDMNQERQESQHLQQCCQVLRNIDEHQCRCQALSQIVSWLVQGGPRQEGGSSSWGTEQGQQGQSRQELMMRARSLPRMCNLGRECEIQPPAL